MAQSSSSTVIGVFDDYKTAEGVARDLTSAGIKREFIDVRSNSEANVSGGSAPSHESQDSGGISGFFQRLFGSGVEEETGQYTEALRRGSAVVSVTAPEDQIEKAVTIMNQRGAVDVDRHEAANRDTATERLDRIQGSTMREDTVREGASREGTSIPVIKEELQVGKRAVQRGGVRVYSRLVEQPVHESIELTQEHVRVDRRPVDRPLAPGEADRLRDQSVEVTEMAEEAVIQKRARVKEEVTIGKETTKHTQEIHEKVRHTEVEVEQLAKGTQALGDYGDDFRRDYAARYANSREPYEKMRPAYEYGSTSANDARYRGRSWADVENSLKTEYTRANPNSAWDSVKGSIRYGWEKVTGKL